MRDALLSMLRLQDRMNARIHPDWIGQAFPWHRAIWIECAELVEHHGYKWWKHQSPDLGQVQLEVVDIWHFGMSARFAPGGCLETLADDLESELSAAAGGTTPTIVDAAERLAAIAAAERRFCATAFATLMAATGLSLPDLYRQYLGKNVLNFFRQDHGYKDGSYRKLWGGREDNEHLMELLPSVNTEDADAEQHLYAALAERYAATA